ncbi:aspartate kinase [Isachenkonia alkalipeptolytica]|uniref:Aspartokinase n=1 Tax=Isachenkonia alkalipeptolytica TaxID=2565777 RepID=A0AA43XI68_9CLOT|nr:aspartate kinase [Isachenkonia alkalipeptolytica]NBG87037.1 aspartate kinase [Isachenkonia alkalipeptolytica]
MKILVQKYGGTSLGSLEKIKAVGEKIRKKNEEGYKILVVLSAMGSATNDLISLAQGITEKPSPREMDMLLATGEQTSISLLTMALIDRGCRAISYTGYQLGIETTALHQNAKIKKIDQEKILAAFEDYEVIVVAGFQGINEQQDYTTLGRGGSDTSAVALACILQARCEIYTDVEGIFTGDPGKLPKARKIENIGYQEMMEMSSLGAGVIHPRAVELAGKYKIPLYVASTFSDQPGTMIEDKEEKMEEAVITGITSSLEDVQITIHQLDPTTDHLYNLFSRLGEENINVDMISQTVVKGDLMNVSFTLPKADRERGRKLIEQWEGVNPHTKMDIMDINEDIAKISVVGLGMRSHSGVAAKVFQTMAENRIPIKMVTTSEISISWVVDSRYEKEVIRRIGEAFSLEEDNGKMDR